MGALPLWPRAGYGPGVRPSSVLWVPEARMVARPAEDACPSLHCPTQLVSSPLTFLLGLLHWCVAGSVVAPILVTWPFQSALFLTDFQLVLTLYSTAPAFLQPKSFWDVWVFSGPLFSRLALGFRWWSLGLPGDKLADSQAKTWVALYFAHASILLVM